MTRPIRFGDWVWNPNTLELRNGPHVAVLEPRVAQLLEYLVTHPGELLSHDRIVESVWDGRVVSDETVRRTVFNLRQALAVDGAAENYIRTVRKKGYVSAFPEPVPVNQEAVALTDAPIPATTPRGTDSLMSSGVPGSAGPAPTSRFSRRLILLTLAAVVALLATLFTQWDAVRHQAPAATDTGIPVKTPATIAVLPLANLSEEADSEFLADGLAEELLGTLALNPGLRVTARSSAFQFKGENRDVREIGKRLGVRYVLEGSVRRSGEQVRILTRLIDAETGTQLWGDAYDRRLADWSALEQEVAVEVARALEFVLPPGGKTVPYAGETSNVEAHMEVLRARQLLASRSVADAERAIEHLQRALTLDPNYALAYARLSDAMLIQAESTTGVKAARPVVAPLLEKALALDPSLGEAYALRSMLTDDPAEAESDLRRGLDLNPSYARGYELLAKVQFTSLKQIDLALTSIDYAIALDPLTPGNYHAKSGILMAAGDWAGAAALDHRALELNPDFRAALVELGWIASLEGRLAEAIGYMERAVTLDPRAVPLREALVIHYFGVGDIDGARAANIPPTPLGSAALLWAQGDVAQVASFIYSGKSGPPGPVVPDYVAQIVLTQALSDRDFARALAIFSAAYSDGEPLPPSTSGWQPSSLANLVQLLDASGDAAAAARLEEKIDASMREVEADHPLHARVNDHARALLLAHAGRREEACAALERVATPTPGPRWGFFTSNPAFDTMRTAPCFKALLARADTYFAGERARLEEMRRAGQIPNRSSPTPARDVARSP